MLGLVFNRGLVGLYYDGLFLFALCLESSVVAL